VNATQVRVNGTWTGPRGASGLSRAGRGESWTER